MNKVLKQAKITTNNLLELSRQCKNIKERQKFSTLGITFVVWLTSNYTIDLTEEIIKNTQLIDIKNNTREAFYTTLNMLKLTKSKLKNK